MKFLWTKIFFQPMYNLLVFIVSILPGKDIGFAVILLTVFIKALLHPLSKKLIINQRKMHEVEGEIKKIKEELKDKKEEQAKKILGLYKERKINPYIGFFVMLIQLPVILALYWVFLEGLKANNHLLYPFIGLPDDVNTNFLGLIDMKGKSIVLAVLAGIAQFFSTNMVHKNNPKPKTEEVGSYKDELMKGLNFQMRYIFPVFIIFIAYRVSAVVALYWVVSNIITMIEQYIIFKKQNGKSG